MSKCSVFGRRSWRKSGFEIHKNLLPGIKRTAVLLQRIRANAGVAKQNHEMRIIEKRVDDILNAVSVDAAAFEVVLPADRFQVQMGVLIANVAKEKLATVPLGHEVTRRGKENFDKLMGVGHGRRIVASKIEKYSGYF